MATVVLTGSDLTRMTEEVRAVVESVTPPAGVRLQEVSLDTDRTGDPAVYIVFRASRRVPLTKKRVSSLGDFREIVTAAVDHLHTGRLPYVRFVE